MASPHTDKESAAPASTSKPRFVFGAGSEAPSVTLAAVGTAGEQPDGKTPDSTRQEPAAPDSIARFSFGASADSARTHSAFTFGSTSSGGSTTLGASPEASDAPAASRRTAGMNPVPRGERVNVRRAKPKGKRPGQLKEDPATLPSQAPAQVSFQTEKTPEKEHEQEHVEKLRSSRRSPSSDAPASGTSKARFVFGGDDDAPATALTPFGFGSKQTDSKTLNSKRQEPAAPKAISRFSFGASADSAPTHSASTFGSTPVDDATTACTSPEAVVVPATAPNSPDKGAVSRRGRANARGTQARVKRPGQSKEGPANRISMSPVRNPSQPTFARAVATTKGRLDAWDNLLDAVSDGVLSRVSTAYDKWASMVSVKDRSNEPSGKFTRPRNEFEKNRDLALLVAIMNGHESVIKFLLGVGADVNHVQPVPAQNAINASANQLICAKYGVGERMLERGPSREIVVRILLNAGARPDVGPLHIAVSWSLTGIVRILLDAGASVDVPSTPSALWRRSFSDRIFGAPLSPLALAAFNGHSSTVNVLLEANAAVDGSPGSFSPVIAAANQFHWEIVLTLARKGADVTVQGPKGLGILGFVAAGKPYPSPTMVHELVALGAQVDCCDSGGSTTLFCALMNDCSVEYVNALISAGASPSTPNKLGQTPLHAVFLNPNAERGHFRSRFYRDHCGGKCFARSRPDDQKLALVDTLVRAGADLNVVCKAGTTPMLCAIQKCGTGTTLELIKQMTAAGAKVCPASVSMALNKDNSILETLLDAGGNPNGTVSRNGTPLLIAALTRRMPSSEDNARMALALLNTGADACVHEDGKSALYWACTQPADRVASVVKLMISRGARVNSCAGSPTDLPLVAGLTHNYSVAKQLIRSGANLDFVLLGSPSIPKIVFEACSKKGSFLVQVRILKMVAEAAGWAKSSALKRHWGHLLARVRHHEVHSAPQPWPDFHRPPFPTMRQWSIATHAELAPSRREAVQTLLFVANRLRGTELGLPPEMWIHILKSALRWDLGADVVPFPFERPVLDPKDRC